MWHIMTALSHRPMEPELFISLLTCKYVAEREGFEPPGRLHDRLLSRQLQSTGLCHRSKPVRRQQVYRSAPVQALFYQVLATVCGQDIQPVVRIARLARVAAQAGHAAALSDGAAPRRVPRRQLGCALRIYAVASGRVKGDGEAGGGSQGGGGAHSGAMGDDDNAARPGDAQQAG